MPTFDVGAAADVVPPLLDERRAWQRTASLTDACGGYMTLSTRQCTCHRTGSRRTPIRETSRVVNTFIDKWQSVSSAGITASFDAEATEVSDDSITDLAADDHQRAQGAGVRSVLLRSGWTGRGRDALSARRRTRRLGGGQVNARDRQQRAVRYRDRVGRQHQRRGRDGQRGAYVIADVYSALEAVPARFRRRASWLLSLEYLNRTRQFATANNYHGFTVDPFRRRHPVAARQPVHESETLDSGMTTSSIENAIIVGTGRTA